MILLLPLRVVGPAGAPASRSDRATPVTWWCVGMVMLIALIDLLVGGRLAHGWPLAPEAVARWWCDVSVRLPLYQDPELYAPTQLWSAALLHDGWFGYAGAWFFTTWQMIVTVTVVLIAGRALERAVGSLSFASMVMLLAPLVGAIHLRVPGLLVLGTSSSFAAALAAAAWGFFIAHRLQMTLVYWLVVVVGAVPFHVHLRWLVVTVSLSEAARLALGRVGDAREHAIGVCAALLLGFAMGASARLLTRLR